MDRNSPKLPEDAATARTAGMFVHLSVLDVCVVCLARGITRGWHVHAALTGCPVFGGVPNFAARADFLLVGRASSPPPLGRRGRFYPRERRPGSQGSARPWRPSYFRGEGGVDLGVRRVRWRAVCMRRPVGG